MIILPERLQDDIEFWLSDMQPAPSTEPTSNDTSNKDTTSVTDAPAVPVLKENGETVSNGAAKQKKYKSSKKSKKNKKVRSS